MILLSKCSFIFIKLLDDFFAIYTQELFNNGKKIILLKAYNIIRLYKFLIFPYG